MNNNGLKKTIGNFARAWQSPNDFQPKNTIAAVETIQKRHDVLNAEPLPQFDLKAIRDALHSMIEKGEPLNGLPKRYLRLAPWVIFYPNNQPELWLGKSSDFTTQYLDWLVRYGRPSSVAVLFRAFLYYYPRRLDTFDMWRNGLRLAITNSGNRRLESLRSYCEYAQYLEPDGPALFAVKLFEKPSADYHEPQSGLSAKFQQSHFLRDAIVEYLEHLSGALASSRISASSLTPHLKLLEGENGKLRFPELKSAIAELLLRPYYLNTPHEDITAVLRSFLLKHLKDPRFKGSDWHRIDQAAQKVMRRWLVSLALGLAKK